jgi:hypothetical protein
MRMRKAAVLALLAAVVAVPTVALAAKLDSSPLSISDGRGLVVLKGRGTVIGRVDRGSITVTDLTPGDTTEPLTFNCDDETFRGLASTCTGDKLRFRMIGGGWRISIKGVGIDLSAAISRGTLYVKGDAKRPGSYSVEGVDCRTEAALCLPLPADGETIQLPLPATP